VRLRDYESNFTSRAMLRVGKKYEVRKGGGGINIVFGQLYRPLLSCTVNTIEFYTSITQSTRVVVVDPDPYPDSMTLWIRIRNPDPGFGIRIPDPGARK
jgi:hypothetical protein